MQETTSFLHNGSIGDVWASIPAMREYYRKTGKKVMLYLVNGQAAIYYEGATHPTLGDDGKTMVMLNETVIKMMLPLLRAQEFIEDASIWSNQTIMFDLNRIRETFVNMPNHPLSHWYFYVFPDLYADTSQVYIDVPETEKDFAKGKVIVTRSERYLNPNISYRFLKKHQPDLLFVGTDLEYMIFKYRFGLMDLERLIINDFLELAQALKQCKFHLSNQTQAFQISEGIKIPRIAELCKFAPNVIPMGGKAYSFYAQEGLEYLFNALNGTLDDYIKTYRNVRR